MGGAGSTGAVVGKGVWPSAVFSGSAIVSSSREPSLLDDSLKSFFSISMAMSLEGEEGEGAMESECGGHKASATCKAFARGSRWSRKFKTCRVEVEKMSELQFNCFWQ